MQPLDRDNAERMPVLQDAHEALRGRARLAVGDVVVYASHGIGRIESTHAAEGAEPAKIVVLLESGLRVTLPLAQARDALRAVSGERELEDVRQTLSADVTPSTEPWSRRHRFAREKLVAGEIGGLAEIVRDGLQRERRLPTTARKPIANELFRQARRLLTAEIARCRGIEPEAADAWVLKQVIPDHAPAEQTP
jgi:RNA polymerase-interacting CarD/CdnL/TRCF family regulator